MVICIKNTYLVSSIITEKTTAKSIYSVGKRDKTDEEEKMLSEIANFISRIMIESDLNKIAKNTVNTIARLFHLNEMIITIWDDEINRFRILACYGYPADTEKEILNLEFTVDWISQVIPDRFHLDEDILFLSAEEIWEYEKMDEPDKVLKDLIEDVGDLTIDHPEVAYDPRESKDQWHELDFFEFIIRDYNGKPIGYLEINDSDDEKLPTMEKLLLILIFIGIAGIAFESARMREKQSATKERIDGLTSLTTQDLNRYYKDSVKALGIIQRPGVNETIWKQSVENLIRSTRESLAIIEKVGKLKEIESRSYLTSIGSDPLIYLNKSTEKIKKKYPELRLNVQIKEKSFFTKCDPSIEDLFNACLETIISMKKRMNEEITIELVKKHAYKGVDEIDISFAAPDIDSITWHRLIRDISSVDPKFGKLSFSSGLFNKYLMVFISRRYGGRAWVEESPANFSGPKGALHVSLPIYEI